MSRGGVVRDAEGQPQWLDGFLMDISERKAAEQALRDGEEQFRSLIDNLPGVTNTCGHTSPSAITELGASGTDEGRAMMQTVHDLAPGSPLDDLDESLRTAEKGGMGGFFGRRRLKKIGAQQASLGWRSVIGKISAAVDWRD
jgi:PAS domain-containing protein